jgi:TolB protein
MTSGAMASAVVMAVALGAATGPAAATFPGRNGAIVFVRSGQIYRVRPDGTHLRRLTDSPTEKYSAAFSADGRRIAFAHERLVFRNDAFSHISIMDASGQHRRQLTHERADDTSPTFSADGRTIAFARKGSIWVMDANGSHQRPVTRDGFAPAFSPDGRRIVFRGSDTKPDDFNTPREKEGIFVVDVDGRRRRELTREPMSAPDPAGQRQHVYIDQDPSFSPDGEHIVFIRSGTQCGSGNVYVMSATGKHVRALTSSDPYCGSFSDPAFSPDGRWVVVSGPYIMRADGTHGHRLAGVSGESPDWQPLPR